jgi:hypothetical protein
VWTLGKMHYYIGSLGKIDILLAKSTLLVTYRVVVVIGIGVNFDESIA